MDVNEMIAPEKPLLLTDGEREQFSEMANFLITCDHRGVSGATSSIPPEMTASLGIVILIGMDAISQTKPKTRRAKLWAWIKG